VLQDNLVAVYGTLKKGYSNNSLLRGSRYVGKGTTLDKYPLEVSGLPYLHDVKGSGYNVDVHIYKVSDNVLKSLDALEGHPHHYKRKEIMIKRKKGQLRCWVYFIQTRPYSNHMNCIQSYKQERPSTNYRGSSYPYNYFRNEDYKPSYTKRITDYYSQQSNDMFADLEDTNERFCSTCMVEVKTDEHEISDSKYYCEICCNHFTESEVMK
jgi:gamma-glutamylaminecyclotransferase